jgi:hypothetical protein
VDELFRGENVETEEVRTKVRDLWNGYLKRMGKRKEVRKGRRGRGVATAVGREQWNSQRRNTSE